MAKKEQSRFIPRAFVNLPREHITAAWSSRQTEMRKVGGGFVASQWIWMSPGVLLSARRREDAAESMNSGSRDGRRI